MNEKELMKRGSETHDIITDIIIRQIRSGLIAIGCLVMILAIFGIVLVIYQGNVQYCTNRGGLYSEIRDREDTFQYCTYKGEKYEIHHFKKKIKAGEL